VSEVLVRLEWTHTCFDALTFTRGWWLDGQINP
jgi:hypothetical protein